jgi:hypothetical protein
MRIRRIRIRNTGCYGYLSRRDGVGFARWEMQAGQPGGQGGRPQESDQALQAQPTQPGEPLSRRHRGGPRASGGTRRSLRCWPVAEGDKRLGKKLKIKIRLKGRRKEKDSGGAGTNAKAEEIKINK